MLVRVAPTSWGRASFLGAIREQLTPSLTQPSPRRPRRASRLELRPSPPSGGRGIEWSRLARAATCRLVEEIQEHAVEFLGLLRVPQVRGRAKDGGLRARQPRRQ